MNMELRDAINSFTIQEEHSLSWWRMLIFQLVEEYEHFIGEKCIHDDEPRITLSDNSFSIWLWTDEKKNSIFSTCWTGVLAGGIIDGNVFSITVDAFLFHPAGKSRLQTDDNKSFVQFVFDTSIGAWIFNGWFEDEWGEWKDVTFN